MPDTSPQNLHPTPSPVPARLREPRAELSLQPRVRRDGQLLFVPVSPRIRPRRSAA
jgi:hypothetical protein